jgi:hypothetical protein
MPKVKQRSLDPQQREQLIRELEAIGRAHWEKHWKDIMALPNELLLEDREGVVRYLLLRVLLNQQGDTGRVRELARELFATFQGELLYAPSQVEQRFAQVLSVFRRVGGPRGSEIYRVGALGGIKPLSLFLYRFAAFSIFVRSVSSLHDLVRSELSSGVGKLLEFFRTDPILDGGWVGNDPKAARMLTNWLAWLFGHVWQELRVDLSATLMIVDGHVGKVFCRTGGIGHGPLRTKASLHHLGKGDGVGILNCLSRQLQGRCNVGDEGAFQVAMGYCTDLNPNCPSCPIKTLCLAGPGRQDRTKYLQWTAYQRYPRILEVARGATSEEAEGSYPQRW